MDASQISQRLRLDGALFDTHLFTVSGTPITIATLVVFGIVLLSTVIFSWLAQRAIARALRRHKVRDEGAIRGTQRLTHYAVLACGFAIGLHTIGINLGALFAAGAIFAVGLGFAMQNIAQNFVAGLIILVERSLTPGDIIRIDGEIVRVEKLGIRATIARTMNDEDLIIPNSNLIQSTVVNHTLTDTLFRVRTQVGVSYGSDLEQVHEVLVESAQTLLQSDDRPPRVLLKDFGDNSVVFDISIWVDSPWDSPGKRSELNRTIWNAFKAAGITIAFPQLDLHLDAPVSDAIGRMGGRAA